jgi:hypothetical protein
MGAIDAALPSPLGCRGVFAFMPLCAFPDRNADPNGLRPVVSAISDDVPKTISFWPSELFVTVRIVADVAALEGELANVNARFRRVSLLAPA